MENSKIHARYPFVIRNANMVLAQIPMYALATLDGNEPSERSELWFSSLMIFYRDGLTCDKCITLGGCIHGGCNKALECNCSLASDETLRDKYEGTHCDIRKHLYGIFELTNLFELHLISSKMLPKMCPWSL